MENNTQKATLSWILYDFANTMFSMNIVSTYFALWLTIDLGLTEFWVGFGNSVSMLLVALTLPVIGVFSDADGRRMPYLIVMTLTCCLATALMGVSARFSPESPLLAAGALVLFMIANYAYQGGLVFYNALLPVVAGRRSRGRVSGYGVAVGYLGAIIGLMAVEPFVSGSMRGVEISSFLGSWKEVRIVDMDDRRTVIELPSDRSRPYRYRLRIDDPQEGEGPVTVEPDSIDTDPLRNQAVLFCDLEGVRFSETGSSPAPWVTLMARCEGYGNRAAFIPTAVLFLLFSLPAFFFIREPVKTGARVEFMQGVRSAVGKLRDVFLDTGRFPGVRRFLVAKYLYEDAIATVIVFMAVYSVKIIGMTNEELVSFFIISTVSAMVGGFLIGHVVDRIGAKRILEATLCLWIICLVVAALAESKSTFWVLGSFIGIALGATWTSSRPFFIELVPEDMLGEFFGLYAFSGKLAAIIGPLLWGGIVYLLSPYGSVAQRVAVLSLAAMALGGLLILRGIPGTEFAKKRFDKQSDHK